MQVKRVVLAALVALGLGGGFGLAALGQRWRAFAWTSSIAWLALGATFVTPWILPIGVIVVVVGCHIDTFLQAYRADTRLRILTPWPWLVIVWSIALALGLRLYVVEAFKIPASSMCPTLQIGDHVLVDKVTRYFRAPRRGDVVVFVYPCDTKRDYVKRVVAVGGDTVEMRCNVLYINGEATPAKLIDEHCTYRDYDESTDQWREQKCSDYRETLDGRTYEIYDDPDRPQHRDVAGARDFPQRDDEAPSCARDPEVQSAPQQTLGKLVESSNTWSPCAPQLQLVAPDGELFVLGDNRYNSNDSRFWGTVPVANVKGTARTIWFGHIGPVR
jgi:signal peptidase I